MNTQSFFLMGMLMIILSMVIAGLSAATAMTIPVTIALCSGGLATTIFAATRAIIEAIKSKN